MIAMVELMAMTAFQSVLEGVRSTVPQLFFATVTLVVGYIAGRITYSVIDRVLDHTHVDEYFAEEGHLELQLSDLFAELGKWLVYFAALLQAAEILQVKAFTDLLQKLVIWIPDVITAIAIFLAGYGIAIYTKDQVIGSETLYADLLGKTVFFFVLLVSLSTALAQVEIDTTLLNNILLVIVASAGLAFAIAAGWGLKDVFQEEAQRYIDERA